MNCPKCGSELEIIYPDGIGKFGCPICKLAENELLPIAIEAKEKAEGELLSLKERLGVGDCNYCHEQKENEIKEIREEAEALSEKLVKENQKLGIKLAKAKGELKAIKARIEAVKITDLYEIKERNKEYGCEDMQEIYHLIKQVGGEK